MSALTAESKRAYIESPFHCPFCNHFGVAASGRDYDGHDIHQRVDCPACGKSWWDVYRVVDMMGMEEDYSALSVKPKEAK